MVGSRPRPEHAFSGHTESRIPREGHRRWLRDRKNASDYLWDAEFAALFRLTNRLMLSAGYRQFKYRRTDDDVTQTVTVVGPAIGLSIGIF